jgi:transcriptional regulator with XRE-family HTH domain
MNIYISENIKRLRHEKNLTQEALADFIGISFQAVSKWECGDAYPDITLLPVIANYFGVTIDELLGNDKIKAEERIQDYLNEYDRLWSLIDDESYEKRFLIAKKAYKEYPYDWRIINKLCDSFVYGSWNDETNYEENKKLIRKLCNMVYDECTNDKFRRNAITYMIRLSEGEEEEQWLNKIDDRLSQKAEKEWNYLSKGRKEEAFLLYQQNMMEYINNLNWKIDTYHQNYSDLISPAERLAVYKINIDLFEVIYGGDINHALIYEDMARFYFSLDDKENGYLYLEKAVDTWIKCLEISESENIRTFKSPLFNRLTWNKPQRKAGTNIYLNNLKTEKEYDPVRNDERFKQCVNRLEELLN